MLDHNFVNDNSLGLLEGVFFFLVGGTNLISIYLYKNVKQPTFSRLKVERNVEIICFMLTTLVSLKKGNVKNSEKLMKIVNIEGENLHISRTTWGSSMKFSGKMRFIVILKVRNSSVSPSLHKTRFWKNSQRGSNWSPNLSRVKTPEYLRLSSKSTLFLTQLVFETYSEKSVVKSVCSTFAVSILDVWNFIIYTLITLS